MQAFSASANHPRSPTAHMALCIALFAEENIHATPHLEESCL